MKTIFETLCSAVHEAAAAIESGDSSVARVKGAGGNYVTPDDETSQEIIIGRIAAEHSETAILAEETEHQIITKANWQTCPSLVIADPIDGTLNHAINIPFSAIMAAHYAYGKATCAVLYNRFARKLYTVLKLADGQWEMRIDGCIISRPTSRMLNRAIIGFNCGYGDDPKRNLPLMPKLLGHVAAVRMLGCTGIEMTFLATGVFDGYVAAGSKPFDLGPTFPFLEAAGIESQKWDGTKATIWDSDFIAASPKLLPKLHALLFD